MRNPKYHIYLTPDERRTVINSLIDFINAKLKMHKIAHSKCTKKIR